MSGILFFIFPSCEPLMRAPFHDYVDSLQIEPIVFFFLRT